MCLRLVISSIILMCLILLCSTENSSQFTRHHAGYCKKCLTDFALHCNFNFGRTVRSLPSDSSDSFKHADEDLESYRRNRFHHASIINNVVPTPQEDDILGFEFTSKELSDIYNDAMDRSRRNVKRIIENGVKKCCKDQELAVCFKDRPCMKDCYKKS